MIDSCELLRERFVALGAGPSSVNPNWTRGLKIPVSVVRFHPWAPNPRDILPGQGAPVIAWVRAGTQGEDVGAV